MSYRIQYRRATAAVAAANNVVLAAGEPGLETDTGKVKVGDGITAWNALAYEPSTGSVATAKGEAIAAAAADATDKVATAKGEAIAAAAADATDKVATVTVTTLGAITPAGVDTKITTERGTERAYQSSTYARPTRGTRTIVLGDSVDSPTIGWFPVTCALTQGRISLLRNAGLTGDTTAMMLARIQTDVIAYAPDVCIIGGPTNDIGLGVAEATTRANLAAIVAALRAADITPVFRNCPPSDFAADNPPWNTVALRKGEIQKHNAWLADYATAEAIPVLDICTPMTSPDSGGYVEFNLPWTGDGIHPGPASVLAAARAIAANLPPLFADATPYRMANTKGVGENLLPNGVFLGDTNVDGVADGWLVWSPGAITPTLTTDDPDIIGNWQNLVGDFALCYADITGLVAGNLVELTGLAAMVTGTVTISLTFQDGAAAQVGAILYPTVGNGVATTKADRAAYRATAVVPVGATQCRVDFETAGAGTSEVSVAQMMLRDLTALGIA